jgi:hypothetical protein
VQVIPSLLTEITRPNWTFMTAMNKRELLKQFDDGDITFKEFFEQYELVLAAEVMNRINHSLETVKLVEAQKRKSLLMLLAAAISLAFILSPPIYSRIFGYANAEECAIHTNGQVASLACYDLYPSVKDKAWAAAGFMDTLLRCEDETGGGLWEREGNLAGNSRLKQSSWSRSAV